MSAAENSCSKLSCTKDVAQYGTKLLLKLKREAVLSDVTLCSDDGRQIKAHKCVLAAASEYFNAMFAGDMAEKQQSSVMLHDVSGDIMQLLVDYIYTGDGDMVINGDNVQDLLVAADRIQMLSIREGCCTFLSQNLTLTNCVDIIVLAKQYSCQQLYDDVCRYCKEHFSDISNSKSFGDVPMPTLIEMISSDYLNVNNEEGVYHSVISWVESDLDTRRAHLPELLSYVRLPLLNKKFLVDEVKREQLITSDSECVQLVMDAMSYHLLEPSERSERWLLKPRIRQRQAIVVYGGRIGSGNILTDFAACYDHITKEWKDFDVTTPLPLVCAGAAVIDETMYIVGGLRRQVDGRHRVRLDQVTLRGEVCSDIYSTVDGRHFQRGCHAMAAARNFHGVTALNDKIYVAGGCNNNITSPVHTAEVYDPDLDQWHSIASLNVMRVSLGLVAVRGCLFAVGGVGINHQQLSSIERYDPSTDQWSLVSDMSVARYGASVAALGDRVYALGDY